MLLLSFILSSSQKRGVGEIYKLQSRSPTHPNNSMARFILRGEEIFDVVATSDLDSHHPHRGLARECLVRGYQNRKTQAIPRTTVVCMTQSVLAEATRYAMLLFRLQGGCRYELLSGIMRALRRMYGSNGSLSARRQDQPGSFRGVVRATRGMKHRNPEE